MYFQHNIGLMYTPNMSNTIDILNKVPYWAADTGCFTKTVRFDIRQYIVWLTERIPYQAACLFATAPDVVGDAVTTLGRSMDVLPIIRELGYKAALVAQDGLEGLEVDWASFDCLFIGGSTDWKLSSASRALCEQARAQGKHVHVGRVNSKRRIDIMAGWPVDSVDGTYLAFGPNVNIRKLTNWLAEVEHQQRFAA